MKKSSKYCFIFFFLVYSILFSLLESFADENIYFSSLKNDEVNLRVGPTFKHPVKLIYKKKYLPILILGKSETFRKVKDFENNSGWIHVSQLTKKKISFK